ncbi:hypothetical protein F3Y22_tig00112507pilonHSYRG00228 [Hibiscus syriacus]|uniref:Uncharacterized protein n=1 Tax=Hibiscus syriacus TaxID=106335 RepID=A0A6A2XVX4_HIBSY|nr:hypothetical protein F3Y22_tig00112507pilonHSYRG00228 [Hibiscus syriacus]
MLSPLSSFPHRREAATGRQSSSAVIPTAGSVLMTVPAGGDSDQGVVFLGKLGDGFIAITGACLGPVLRVEFGESPSYVVTHPIAATCGGQLDLLERSVEAVAAAS